MGIKVENIEIGYDDRTLIQGASLSIPKGDITALLGRNGTGKSSLLRALSGLSAPEKGSIKLGGVDIYSLTASERAKVVSFVTTDKVRIANLTCEDVVALGRAPYTNWMGRISDEDRHIVHRSLQQVGMSDFTHRTMDQMSDGECQRVMIARALAQDTPVILLDEPTAFLDLPNRYELCFLLRELAHSEQKTILFSTHELDIAEKLCDSVALIDSPNIHHLSALQFTESKLVDRMFSASKNFEMTSKGVMVIKKN